MDWKKFWQQRQASLASGVAALVIIGLGFLLFNNANQNTSENKSTKQELTGISTNSAEKKIDVTAKSPQPETKKEAVNKTTSVTYHVASGESLSDIAFKFYGDGNKWTLIASANKIANPRVIHAGNVLTIPDVTSTSAQAAAQPGQTTPKQTVQTYTVKSGDSLWSIAEGLYGSGYNWYKIRDANKDTVGTLPNGRPLIFSGQVLKIPAV